MKKINLILVLFAVAFITSCNNEKCEYTAKEIVVVTPPDPDPEPEPSPCEKGMDIAFLIDYTKSMEGAIESVKTTVNEIVDQVNTLSKDDYRLSLSLFDEQRLKVQADYENFPAYQELPHSQKIVNTGSTTKQYLTMMEKFSDKNHNSFKKQLNKINTQRLMPMGNGWEGPEPGDMLLDKILNEKEPFAGAWRDDKITKLAIIITNAPAGGDDDKADETDDEFLKKLAEKANKQKVQCILILKKDSRYPTNNYAIHLIGNNKCGKEFVVNDFNGVGEEIIKILKSVCEDGCYK